MKIGDILLGRINKRYTHDMSANNSTTFGFGNVQPLYCTYVHKGSDVKINMRQLLRPAPMVSPTFGRVQAHTVTRFVAMKDIYPAFDALLAHKAIQGNDSYIPNTEPVVRNSALVLCLLLHYSSFDVYKGTSSTNFQLQLRPDFTDDTALKIVLDKFIPDSSPLSKEYIYSNLHPKMSQSQSETSLTPQSSDFVFSYYDFILCFRLTEQGRNIYKILTGLGYGLDYSNSNKVSSLPIFAFYKAYFDTYFNKRFINWHDTNVYQHIQKIYNDGESNYLLNFYVLESFIANFSNLLYSSPADYVSVHTIDPLNGATQGASAPFSDVDINSLDYKGTLQRTNEPDGKVPNLDTSDRTTWYQLQALKKLTQYISKDSVIGGRVVDWFKVHFGVTPSEDMFLPSQFIDEHIVNLDIDDVFTTADTYNAETNSGSYTGSYAGKGLGYGQTNGEINFTSKDFGYLIILGALAPEQVYFSGDSPQLYGIDRYTLPNQDFDAMGYELTPLACFASYSAHVNGRQTDDVISSLSLAGKSFGYIPRYSGFKVQKSVVNGDFSLRSVRSGLDSYFLDKKIDNREISLIDGNVKSSNDTLIPTASTLWSYPTGIPDIGDYNRIFYNRGFPTKEKINWWTEHPMRNDDNFIFQSRFEVKITNPFKPIRESYQIDDPEENSTSSVTAQ